MYQLKKLDLGSVALFTFLLTIVVYFLFCIPFALLMGLISSLAGKQAQAQTPFPLAGGFFFVIFGIAMPIGVAIMQTAINLLMAALYNFFSKKFGGIKFEMEKIAVIGEKIGEIEAGENLFGNVTNSEKDQENRNSIFD